MRRPLALLVSLALALPLAGCARVKGSEAPKGAAAPSFSAEFKPYTVSRPPPSTAVAKLFYRGDAPDVNAAGARLLGFVHVTGKTQASEDEMSAGAASAGAREGGTHVLLSSEEDAERLVVTKSASASTSCYTIGANVFCDTKGRPEQTATVTTKRRIFAVFAVPVDAWGSLPRALWPKPLAQPRKDDEDVGWAD